MSIILWSNSVWHYGIDTNDIITKNEGLEFLPTSIIEIINIDELSHEEAIVIFITNKDLNMSYIIYQAPKRHAITGVDQL